MCGIFGVIVSENATYSSGFLIKSVKTLAKLSQRRGKDSSGLCAFNQESKQIEVLKGPVRINELLKRPESSRLIHNALGVNSSGCKYIYGHSRLVTNGTQLNDNNNQPVVKDGIVGVHNGIVTNVDELWDKYTDLNRENEIDTEVMLALVRKFAKNGSLEEGVVKAVRDEVLGTVSTALVFEDYDRFVLATNNGSLYVLTNWKDILFFASEIYILNEFEKKSDLSVMSSYDKKQLRANTGIAVSLETFGISEFQFSSVTHKETTKRHNIQPIKISTVNSDRQQISTVMDLNLIHFNPKAEVEMKQLIYPVDKIKELKRCSKCLLPETFPFINYDEEGVCNYCHNYKKSNQPRPLSELMNLVDPYRRKDGKPDVLLPFSGGRDSTYVLHVVKEELGLNPITYTYDWGMVTDLARRNVARICGKLGVENIIVAADMHWKRENIRKNITAWLKKPELGMIPLFMAGDKFFFYYAHKIKKQLGIELEIWGVNHLENTNFKTGFAGLRPEFDKKRIYSVSLQNQMKLFGFVGANMLKSPGYFNQSILDSLGSFASRYVTPKSDYYHLFDYAQWDEKHIEDTIINNYHWEKAVDTDSTWRIGDGTASFYNYIYTLVAGFSENDTFRSNQIREGMITREEALEKIYQENKPRYNSVKWYLEILGLSFEATIKTINQIPRMY
ncbi:MAG: glucosamine 6-phosphate synthetase [Cytophagales bacterium CG12_big_fil_rev_8_21_14_0_65_40_12]|nr:MAG: glucosamine 6-phosphate synthetase [Cytophagales bacterium CG12_big_fil_rev_8_21_14_0_65_40_12]PIW04238.1 MAG: glucosamine 6-phosphate synthetase [Cytophagales bacterium CG17_big_fil_post_rev_8_21_14_2_50_40_13]